MRSNVLLGIVVALIGAAGVMGAAFIERPGPAHETAGPANVAPPNMANAPTPHKQAGIVLRNDADMTGSSGDQSTASPNALIIEPLTGDSATGSAWAFVANGTSSGGYLYPYVFDGRTGRYSVDRGLRAQAAGTWLGAANIGDNNTSPGDSYSVSIVQSNTPLQIGPIPLLPAGARVVSNSVTVTRK